MRVSAGLVFSLTARGASARAAQWRRTAVAALSMMRIKRLML